MHRDTLHWQAGRHRVFCSGSPKTMPPTCARVHECQISHRRSESGSQMHRCYIRCFAHSRGAPSVTPAFVCGNGPELSYAWDLSRAAYALKMSESTTLSGTNRTDGPISSGRRFCGAISCSQPTPTSNTGVAEAVSAAVGAASAVTTISSV